MGRSEKMQLISDIRQLKERCKKLEKLISENVDVEVNKQYLQRLQEQVEKLYDRL